jgi:hypothetical protein
MIDDFLINLSNQYNCNITYIEYSLTPMLFVLLGFGIFLLSIMFHELGHLLAFKMIGIKTYITAGYETEEEGFKITAGREIDYIKASKEDKIFVYSFGLILGLIPIFIASFYMISYLILIAPYILGSIKDIQLIIKNWS